MAFRGTRITKADHDPAADAREAAERAGLSLDEWLEAVLEDRTETAAVPPVSAPAPSRHRDRAADPFFKDRNWDDGGRNTDPDSIERRLGRLVGALGSNVPIQREDAPAAMRDLADRLEGLKERGGADRTDRRATRDTVRELEERLQAIAQRMDAGRMDATRADTGRPNIGRPDTGVSLSAPSRETADRAADAARDRLQPHADAKQPAPRRFGTEERPARAPIAGLKEAIAEVAARQRSLEGEFVHTVATHTGRLDRPADTAAERPHHRTEETLSRSALRNLRDEAELSAGTYGTQQAKAMADLLAVVGDLTHRIEAIPGRIGEDLAERLEDTVRRLDTATRAEIDSIRGELREMAQDIDRNTRSDLEALRKEIERLAEQIANAPSISVEIETRIEDIADRLDTAARSEFGALRTEIRALAEQLEQSDRSAVEILRGDLRELGERLSQEYARTASRGLDDSDLAHLEAIRSEIRELANQIDTARRDDYEALRQDMQLLAERISGAPSARIAELERHLVLLTEQLAKAAQDDDPEMLAQLERKIAELAENVDASSRSMAGIDGLEKTIGDLFARIEENRVDALEAAREAAREAVERASASLVSDGASDIHAVHQTLKTIVDRLEDLEYETDGGKVPEAPRETATEIAEDAPANVPEGNNEDAAPPEPDSVEKSPGLDPDDIVGRIDAVAKTFAAEEKRGPGEDDTPLVPGTRQPKTSFDFGEPYRGDAERSEESAIADALFDPAGTADAKPTEGQSDFVAAARRAARAATAEHAESRRKPAKNTSQRLKGLRNRFEYRRALPIAAATVIVVFGAFEIATYVDSNPDMLSAGGVPATEKITAEQSKPAGGRAADREPTKAARTEATGDRAVRTVEKSGSSTGDPTGSISSSPATTQSLTNEPTAANPEIAPQIDQSAPAEQDAAIPANLLPNQLRLAAEADDPAAQFEIAARYMDGRGLPQSDSLAADWYRKAATQGLAPAQYRLGSLYEKGQGLGRDLSMARMWYQRAAEQGNRNAMHNLAVLYADGLDGAPDYEKAATWFRKAAEYGLADSQFNLAVLYARGLGVQADLGESYRWFAIAASQGDAEALQKRDEIGRNLDQETLNRVRAAADAWEARPPETGANSVPEPQGGWGDPRPKEQTLITREMIVAAQSLLNDLGYAAGPPDGQIGPRTRDAVRAFQRSVGLPDTGDISPELIDQLGGAAG